MADNPVVNAFKSHGVVPDVVSQAPNDLVKVRYDSGVEVSTGNELTPTQVQNEPTVEWSAEADKLYTLIMTDPDAPTRSDPTFREMKHWLVVNIPAADISRGETLAAYIGSGPPQGTGLHRYIFLVYKQTGKVDTTLIKPVANNSRRDRPKFRAAKFAEEHGLGAPVAGNFYQAQFDDFVPILRSRISDN